MLTERNPYDPTEISWPPFTYWVKAGLAFTIGAGLAGVAWTLTFWFGILPWLSGWIALATRSTHR